MRQQRSYITRSLLLAASFVLPQIAFAQGLMDGHMRGARNIDLAISVSRESFNEFWAGAQRVSLEMASSGAFKFRGGGHY